MTPDASFQDDLNADDQELADLFGAIEEEFEIKIADEDLPSLLTVGDAVDYLEDDQPPQDVADYARHLVQGVRDNQAEIDAEIIRAAPAWPLDQMATVDKSILRLAIFEMLHEEGLSVKVAINEAVELAKLFGHESSPKFVNGVLGTIERERRTKGLT